MAPLITPQLIVSAGIELAPDELDSYVDELNDMLMERIGEAVAETLADDELKELTRLQETADDESLNEWLNENVPELNEIIQDEIDILLGDIAEENGVNQTLHPDKSTE